MLSKSVGGGLLVCVCVAIYASAGAGVVSSDIGAFGAAALVSGGLLVVLQAGRVKEFFDDGSVNAVGLFYS